MKNVYFDALDLKLRVPLFSSFVNHGFVDNALVYFKTKLKQIETPEFLESEESRIEEMVAAGAELGGFCVTRGYLLNVPFLSLPPIKFVHVGCQRSEDRELDLFNMGHEQAHAIEHFGERTRNQLYDLFDRELGIDLRNIPEETRQNVVAIWGLMKREIDPKKVGDKLPDFDEEEYNHYNFGEALKYFGI